MKLYVNPGRSPTREKGYRKPSHEKEGSGC